MSYGYAQVQTVQKIHQSELQKSEYKNRPVSGKRESMNGVLFIDSEVRQCLIFNAWYPLFESITTC